MRRMKGPASGSADLICLAVEIARCASVSFVFCHAPLSFADWHNHNALIFLLSCCSSSQGDCLPVCLSGMPVFPPPVHLATILANPAVAASPRQVAQRILARSTFSDYYHASDSNGTQDSRLYVTDPAWLIIIYDVDKPLFNREWGTILTWSIHRFAVQERPPSCKVGPKSVNTWLWSSSFHSQFRCKRKAHAACILLFGIATSYHQATRPYLLMGFMIANLSHD